VSAAAPNYLPPPLWAGCNHRHAPAKEGERDHGRGLGPHSESQPCRAIRCRYTPDRHPGEGRGPVSIVRCKVKLVCVMRDALLSLLAILRDWIPACAGMTARGTNLRKAWFLKSPPPGP